MYIGLPIGEKHHMTFAFCGHDETRDQYKRAVLALASAAVEWSGPKLDVAFYPEAERFAESGAWHVKVLGSHIYTFRQLLTHWLDWYSVEYSSEFSFTPHVTLSYFSRKPKNPYLNAPAEFHNYVEVISNEWGTTRVRI